VAWPCNLWHLWPIFKHTMLNESSVIEYIAKTFPDVETTENFGYAFFFYKTERMLPFATLGASDNEYDRLSNLDRPGVYRLNIGISRKTFQALFGETKVDVKNYDYTALDVIMPHPEYAPQNFVCVLAPSDATFERVRELLAEAYDIAVQRYNRQNKNK